MGRKPTAEELVEEHKSSAKIEAAAAKAAKKLGAKKATKKFTRAAATHKVVARYYGSGRCQFGHKNCTSEDH